MLVSFNYKKLMMAVKVGWLTFCGRRNCDPCKMYAESECFIRYSLQNAIKIYDNIVYYMKYALQDKNETICLGQHL